MRLPLLPPDRQTNEQRAFYARALNQIEHGGFDAFRTRDEDGALLGPWGVFMHEPSVGQAHYDQVEAISALKRLPDAAKQIAILVVGGRFKAAYELYAHVATAAKAGMDAATLATISAGQRPVDLSHDEAIAFDVAAALLGGGVLPDAIYRAALDRFGQRGLNELILWVGLYAQVSITLNAFDVPSEQRFDGAEER